MNIDMSKAAAAGKGMLCPAGSIKDPGFTTLLFRYRKRVVGGYRALVHADIDTLGGGPWLVSPKVDGELWFLVMEGGDAWLVTTRGKVLCGDVPLLAEARKVAAGLSGRSVIAGELFAASKDRRPRVGDVAAALADGAVERLGFSAFDVLEQSGDATVAHRPYADRLEIMRSLLPAPGQRLKVIRTDSLATPADVKALYDEVVIADKAEGLILRAANGLIHKLKPERSLDLVMLGFTEKTGDPDSVRSVLVGIVLENGQLQVISGVGNLGSDADRKGLMQRLRPLVCASSWRHSSGSGEAYTFVAPMLVAEIKVTDVQMEDSAGEAIRNALLTHTAETGIELRGHTAGATLLHPVIVRLREDKEPCATDAGIAQLTQLGYEARPESVIPAELPKSTLLRRDVWTKDNKGKLAVRKLLAWKTNKDTFDPQWPAYVVHWTDYSPGRGTPLDRDVRVAEDEAAMNTIIEGLVTENIKKGWNRVGEGA